MFIQPEPTPNPATLKFLPGRSVLTSGTLDMRDKEAAAQSPLAERLFAIAGISGVFFGSDFIAVTKTDGEWQQLKPAILGVIMEHFMSGTPIVSSADATPSGEREEFFEAKDSETVATIKELIEARVRPAVANDGGDITFRGFKDGIVYLDMKEACSAAVLDTNSGIAASETLAMTRGHAEAVTPLIARVMSAAAIEFVDLDRIAVTTGPGSFTGLRVGISATRGIALAAGKPAVGHSTLAGFAA